jgi:polyvinyl alcohol dehydrogenase (cytochrome)
MAHFQRFFIMVGFSALIGAGVTIQAEPPDGAAVYSRACASCHNGGDSRAPAREVLAQRSPEAILSALTAGIMRPQGARIDGLERRAVAEFLSGKTLGGDVTGATIGRCTAQPTFPGSASLPAWTSWGGSVTNTRFQPPEQAGLSAEQVPYLALKWAFGFPDATSAWSQPTIFGGRLFVGSHNGTVYSLDAKTGCIYWTYSAKSSVRSAVSIGPRNGARGYAAYFGDTAANAYALDAATGKEIWFRKIDEHPMARATGSPTLYQGLLYVGVSSFEETQGSNPQYECCTFRGSLSALDTKTGAVAWKTYLVPEPKPLTKNSAGTTLWGPSGAGIWSAPAIDVKRGVVYAATGNTYTPPQLSTSDSVIAFDLKTSKIKWTQQVTPKDVFGGWCRPSLKNPICPEENGPDFDFGNAPILAKLPNGKDVIIIGQKSGVGWALDPDKEGAPIWQYRAGQGSALGGMEWGSAVDDQNAYFPVSDISLPKPGGLHAVQLTTGERVWYAPPPAPICGGGRGCNAAQSAAVTVIKGVVFSGSNDGALRAYSTKDGSIIWEYDTNRDFKTLNGVPAKGASLHSAGATIAGGMLYVNSGYGDHGGRPGNVLLAFGVE